MLVERLTTHSTGTEVPALGPENAIEILKLLEESTFSIMCIALFGPTALNDLSAIQHLLLEFRDAFAMKSTAQAGMAWETIFPSHLFFALVPLGDLRKARTSMQGVKKFCRRQITQRKSQVCTTLRFVRGPSHELCPLPMREADLRANEVYTCISRST